jgi:hypothetical protein
MTWHGGSVTAFDKAWHGPWGHGALWHHCFCVWYLTHLTQINGNSVTLYYGYLTLTCSMIILYYSMHVKILFIYVLSFCFVPFWWIEIKRVMRGGYQQFTLIFSESLYLLSGLVISAGAVLRWIVIGCFQISASN